jgi:hypothetical protein
MVFISFSSSHHSTWCCFCYCSVYNLVLANLTIVKVVKPRKKEKEEKEKKIENQRNQQGD